MQRQALAKGELVYRFGSLKAPEDGSRTVKFIASDESVDRMGDVIRASGWDLKNFKANPVLLYAHQSRELPIGKVTDIYVEGTQLMATAEFMSGDINPKAEAVFRMVKEGYLNATSVGFMPTKQPNEIKDPVTNKWTYGYEFIAQELMELSVVPVPANPAALALARSFVGDADEFLRTLRTVESVGASAEATLQQYLRETTISRLGRRVVA